MASTGIETFKICEHPPVCPRCKEVFAFRYQLEWHFQWKHNSLGKLFICGECNLSAIGESFCKLHIRSLKQTSRSACEKCGILFETDLDLRRHQLTHKSERFHVCPMCSRSFTHKSILERHSRLNCCAKSLVSKDVCRGCFSRRSFIAKHTNFVENSGA
ncbi:zinc finger protein 343 [Parasteatoda tepidariorum]|uniref:zinc finger protein 343 n=1 Tax=Parasteatoda tepidariorum TaxID=114398 RepID=UPI00077FCAF3|nr:gastrula zinc finger protein XlCGF67.1 [Parasteatoda tepidariorum]